MLIVLIFLWKKSILNSIFDYGIGEEEDNDVGESYGHRNRKNFKHKMKSWLGGLFSKGHGINNNHDDYHDNKFIEKVDSFLKDWKIFYKSYQNGEFNNDYNFDCSCGLLCIFISLIFVIGPLSYFGYKFGERYIFINGDNRENVHTRMSNDPRINELGIKFSKRRSFLLRLRAWRKSLAKNISLLMYQSKIASVENYEDENRKVYAYSIPIELVPRVNVHWKEIGNDPSTMEIKIVLDINSLPSSFFSTFPRLGNFIFGDSMNETDLFGAYIPVIELTINKNTVDPGDIVTFWESLEYPISHDQDDRLLYIHVPKLGHRVTKLQISNGSIDSHLD